MKQGTWKESFNQWKELVALIFDLHSVNRNEQIQRLENQFPDALRAEIPVIFRSSTLFYPSDTCSIKKGE